MSLNILFDATPYTANHPSGAGRYVVSVLRELALADTINRYLVFGFEPTLPFADQWPQNFRYEKLALPRWLGPFARETARHRFVKRACKNEKVDLVQSNLDPLPVSQPGVKSVCMLYDVMRWGEAFLSQTPTSIRSRMRTRMRYSLAAKADHLLTISEFSKEQIVRTLGVSPDRITVTHLAADERFLPGTIDREVLEKMGIDKPYILFVGQFGRQKNEAGLIEAFSLAVELNLLPPKIELVLVGDLQFMSEPMQQWIDAQPMKKRIRLMGNVAEQELVHLYRGALLFALVSFEEGFGLPALEAMACGTPVLVSNVSSLPEIVQDAGLIVSPNDLGQIAKGLSRLYHDTLEGQRLSAMGLDRARSFSFKTVAQKTLNLYRMLCVNNP